MYEYIYTQQDASQTYTVKDIMINVVRPKNITTLLSFSWSL